MEEKNIRGNFIKKIGLNHDPFETPVAEQELTRVQDRFYSYFSAPLLSSSQEGLLRRLRKPQSSFVFGEPGSGKSTLRLTLEADCRTVLDGTLAINYALGEDIKRPLSHEEHGARLARALTVDLTLAIIEQFSPLHPPTSNQIESLKRQVLTGGRQLQRLLRTLLEKMALLEESAMDPVWGISQVWKVIGKAPTKYVGASKELENVLRELILPNQRDNLSWDDFWYGISVAQEWGFKRFFILVDGVDARQRTPGAMLGLIAPLLDIIPSLEEKNIYPKMFLPVEIKHGVKDYLGAHLKGLPFEMFFSIMEWDDIAMRRLLAQRFRAAMSGSGPYHAGLDSLATPNLNLDEKLINAAEGSPRRLLGIVSNLIDVHLERDPDSIQFNQKDWETCQKKLETDAAIESN